MMNRRASCFAAVLLVGHSPYSCHKPTLQEEYADSKRCYSAYDAGLEMIPAARFEQAGLDPDVLKTAAHDNFGSAYVLGKQLGMRPEAIARDVERTRAAYLAAHSDKSGGARKLKSLRDDVNDCLGDDYGRPND
jgi:hypothetical protein